MKMIRKKDNLEFVKELCEALVLLRLLMDEIDSIDIKVNKSVSDLKKLKSLKKRKRDIENIINKGVWYVCYSREVW